MNELLFSPEALSDLQEIKRYITQELGSPDAAENTLRKIMKHIRLLEAQPMIGAPLSSIISISTHYRFLVCGNYLAFYYVETKKVYIVRVIYSRRDYIRILFGDLPDEDTDE